jgi:RNA polymerase sigma-70 factor (ECF subfamily)
MQQPRSKLDPGILALAKRGDEAAHAAVYRAYAPLVFTIARRMLASRALAEDVLQDTFVEVILKIATFRGDGELGAWNKRIAINKCLSQLRSVWSVRRVAAEDAESLVHSGTTRNVAEDQVALERALDELTPHARAVVWLYDVEGYTHKEIGRLMGRTTSFSKSQLMRAHRQLRESLEGALDEGAATLCTAVLKTC